MKISTRKFWLASMALLLLLPAISNAASLKPRSNRDRDRWVVPEGGSALVYVLGAGLTFVGAMAVRCRSPKHL